MKLFFEYLLLLTLFSAPAADSRQQEQNRQALDSLRQEIVVHQVRMEEGRRKLEEKIRSLRRFPNEAPAFLERMEASYHSLRIEQNLLDMVNEEIIRVQEASAPEPPNDLRVPKEALNYMAQGELSLPQGAPGMGPGFSRACPAEVLTGFSDGKEDEGLEIDGLSWEEPEKSRSLMMPAAGYLSAGTWAYPSGALHLGMDLALSMFTPVYAPADGVILYAASVTGDGGGYLGNWTGWPYGGGNTIAMLCKSGSRLYGVTFCHLSSRIAVRAGQKVHQGDLIAYSGNTGNSTGPHTHIELFELRVSFTEAVQYFQQGADFSFGTGWSQPATCSWLGCRRRPELYFQK